MVFHSVIIRWFVGSALISKSIRPPDPVDYGDIVSISIAKVIDV